ncbi:MAG: dual specificity protein phosphatase family protein, partial [Oligoflexales bacterium]
LENRELCSISDNEIRKSEFKLKKFIDPIKVFQAKEIITAARNETCKEYQDPMSSASQITEQIYLGPHTVARDRNQLEKLNISAVISMTAECGIIFPEDDTLEYFYQGDKLIEHECTIDDVVEIIDDVFEFADEKLSNGTDKIFIHCVQGKTRSAAAVTYILAKRGRMTIKDAYNFVKSKRDVNIPSNWLEALQNHLDAN